MTPSISVVISLMAYLQLCHWSSTLSAGGIELLERLRPVTYGPCDC